MLKSDKPSSRHSGIVDVLPVFINPGSGSADQTMAALADDKRLRLEVLEPLKLADAVQAAADQGVARVAVCGGDGTLALAASRLVGSKTALAVLPGGTLNHFASRMGIPEDLGQAVNLALTGRGYAVGVGYVNRQLFINTSSVGAYATFVRSRDYLERRHGMGYHLASLLAGIRRLVRLHSARIKLNGRDLRAPLVFVGIHERELQLPALGQHKANGDNGLHLIAVRRGRRSDTLRIALNAIFRGIDPLVQSDDLENRVMDHIDLHYRRNRQKVTVAVDGELVKLDTPLKYRYAPCSLLVVTSRVPTETCPNPSDS